MYFQPGQCPHIDDKEGWKVYKKAIIAEIKKLGGKSKESQGIGSLRKIYSELMAKKRATPESVIDTPESRPTIFKPRKK